MLVNKVVNIVNTPDEKQDCYNLGPYFYDIYTLMDYRFH